MSARLLVSRLPLVAKESVTKTWARPLSFNHDVFPCLLCPSVLLPVTYKSITAKQGTDDSDVPHIVFNCYSFKKKALI